VSTATATTYHGTFHGRAEEAARVRREIARYLKDCPVTDDMVLIADELAANSILHSRSRGGSFTVRCDLSPGTARIEVEDTGGPWRPRASDDRPHGLDIVAALTGPDGWGTQRTPAGTRVVWATLQWPGRTKRCNDMRDTWETTARAAATTMLRYPDKISDGLEAELYALLEKLDTPPADQPKSTGAPDDAP
jgi:Histidine kinase-like ATPase domain